MKALYIFLIVIAFFLLSCSQMVRNETNVSPATTPARLAAFPDNPCEILSVAQMSAATGLQVTSANRVPSLEKIVDAQTNDRDPGPGTLCVYETHDDVGAIVLSVPARTDRSAAKYWTSRTKYIETFPGDARPVPGLGQDAWLSGGTALHVLAGDDESFTISTQMYQPRSGQLLINIAGAVLAGRTH